jgi:pyruvate dehydrogenase E2 component (dihydrolipoamide acetyltransferase)
VIGDEGEEVSAAESPAESPDGDASPATSVEESSEEEGSPGAAREAERAEGRRRAAQTQQGNGTSLRPAEGRLKASPLARRIARERGIDLARLEGTGPDGRIVAEDVERAEKQEAAPAGPARGEVEVRQLSSVRRTIARRLTEAWQAPVFQLTVSLDMTQPLDVIERLRELHSDERPTLTDLLTRVTAAALMRHRDVNAHFADDEIRVHPTANIGIAVAAPQGLVVPVIQGVERLTIAEVARARAEVVGRARENKLRREDLEGGTFTISNLGMFGIEQFIAVLNPPQVAILAVGSTEERVVVRDDGFTSVPTLTATLTCDHRAVDGAVGAQFLQTLKALLEQPALAL